MKNDETSVVKTEVFYIICCKKCAGQPIVAYKKQVFVSFLKNL